MLKEEAVWFRDNLEDLISDNKFKLGKIANVGSSSEEANRVHPWIENIFLSFIRENGRVYNIDIKKSPNVDIVGNLLDEKFIAELNSYNFDAVCCLNVLTCIEDKKKLSKALIDITEDDGLILVSSSKRHPFVKDPVDTMFRPTVEELHELFPGTEILRKGVVESESYFQFLAQNKKILTITMARMFVPFYNFDTWLNLIKYLPNLFSPYQTTCLILQKRWKFVD